MKFKRYKINKRVITDLKKRSTLGLVFYIILVFLVLFIEDYYSRNQEFSNFFVAGVLAICLFRYLHLVLGRFIHEKYESVSNSVFIVSVALTAAIWGIGFLKLGIQNDEPETQLLMIICTVGLCSGGAIAFMPDFRLSVIFNFFMLLPASIVLMVNGMNVTLGFCIFLYACYLVLVVKRGNKEYWDALENEFLLKKKTSDLEKISRMDVLTGIYNRRFFDDFFTYEFRRAMRQESSIIMMICDIDHFKQVNDQYGHLAGDEFLKRIAGILLKVFKRETDIVARYGGEEFVILMQEESIDNAIELAQKFRLLVQKSVVEYA
ncbi:MAG: diguanylate cyclase, partial [Desulfobacteraceae bacterium]|nr:diguanylate cyclase [Desulfobacteraceae bacterium]